MTTKTYCSSITCWYYALPPAEFCELCQTTEEPRKVLAPAAKQAWWEENTEVFEPAAASSDSYVKLLSSDEMLASAPSQPPSPAHSTFFPAGLAPIIVARDPSIRNTGRFDTIDEDAPYAHTPDVAGYDFLHDDPETLFGRPDGRDPRKKKKNRNVPKTPDVTPRSSVAATPRTPLGMFSSHAPPDLLVEAKWISDPAVLQRAETYGGGESDSTPEDSQFSSPVGSYSFASASLGPDGDDYLSGGI